MRGNHLSVYIFAIITALMLCLESIPLAHGAQVPDPTDQLRPSIAKLIGILTEPELQGMEKSDQRRELAMEMARERFDFKEMSKRVLGKTWRKLSPEEQGNFVTMFTKLLEYAYIEKIEGYSDQQVLYLSQRIKGERAQVNTKVADNKTGLSVSYIMLLKDEQWMVYDIIVEGISLVRNYMEQFQGIIRKDGYSTLVKQVETKIEELGHKKG